MRLRKSPVRAPEHPSFGKYALVDSGTGMLMLGGAPWTYSATLEDVADFLTGVGPADGDTDP